MLDPLNFSAFYQKHLIGGSWVSRLQSGSSRKKIWKKYDLYISVASSTASTSYNVFSQRCIHQSIWRVRRKYQNLTYPPVFIIHKDLYLTPCPLRMLGTWRYGNHSPDETNTTFFWFSHDYRLPSVPPTDNFSLINWALPLLQREYTLWLSYLHM